MWELVPGPPFVNLTVNPPVKKLVKVGHRQYFHNIADSEIKFLLKRNPHWDKVGKVKGKKTSVVFL